MNYSELVEQTKKELEKSYGTSAALTQLYNNAKANYEKQHKESVESLNKDYEEKKNQAAAQKLTDEKNTGEFLASRGLSFSGESAQARLNSDISFNNTLSSLAKQHSEGLSQLHKSKNEYFGKLDADYAKDSITARKELQKLAQEMADNKIKYGDVILGGDALGTDDGDTDGDGIVFTPNMSAYQLASAIVKRYGSGGKISKAEHNLNIRNYLEKLTSRYNLTDEYMDKVIFVLDALGYTAMSETGTKTATIVNQAELYHDKAYSRAKSLAKILFTDYDDRNEYAEKHAYMEKMDYVYTRCETMDQFYEACLMLGLNNEKTEEYLDIVAARRNTENEIKLGQNKS